MTGISRKTQQASGAYKTSAQAGDNSVPRAKCRRSLSGTIKEDELVLEKQGFGDDGPSTTGSAQASEGNDGMKQQDDDIAHYGPIVANGHRLTRV